MFDKTRNPSQIFRRDASSIVIQVVPDRVLGHNRLRLPLRVCFMIFIPLPFVVALLLLLLLAALLHHSGWRRQNRPFLVLIGFSALQSIVLGLRWGYGVAELRYVLPILASCFPPLVLASFRSLIDRAEAHDDAPAWFHALPPFAIAALLFLAPGLIDFALMALFLGYAFALLKLGRSGPDALDEARFDGAVAAHRALIIAAVSLCLSASFDLAVLLDFEWSKGNNAAIIVGNANLLGLLLLGLTAIVAARAKAPPETQDETASSSPTAALDQDVLERIARLLAEQKLFLDENLTLSRLARRAGIPARQISGAVNRLTQKNVSQFINDYRIAEACRRLRQADISITAAMLESGFQTKSNFNREFRRVTSSTPADWRARNRGL